MTTVVSPNPLFACRKCGFTDDTTDSAIVVSADILGPLSASNESPSPNEFATLTGEYEAISQAISSLNSEIAFLQAKLGTLEDQRRELVSSRGVYKIVLNPCRRLPSEILTLIFGLCVKEDIHTRVLVNTLFTLGSDQCPSSLDTRKSPWVLGQVCRRWRNLMLSLPDLWSTIEINRQPPTEIFEPFIERRLSLTLQRSRERPLHISWSQWSGRERTSLLGMLGSRSFQWKSATIRANVEGLRLLYPYSGAFPILSTLHLNFSRSNWMSIDENDTVFSIFRDAPALRHITLSGDWTVAPRLRTQIPWNQITRLVVQQESEQEIWCDTQTLLPWLTHVEELCLRKFGFVHIGNSLTLAHLHTLTLSADRPSDMSGLLNSLILPSLRKLTILSRDRQETASIQSTLELLERSACRLEEFVVPGKMDDVIVDLLKAGPMQTVHTISLQGRPRLRPKEKITTISDAVLSVLRLLPFGENTNVLPHLIDLTLTGLTKKWSDRCLVEMLASRRDVHQYPPGSVSRLHRVTFCSDADIRIRDTSIASQLKDLIEGGLIINNGDASVLLGQKRR